MGLGRGCALSWQMFTAAPLILVAYTAHYNVGRLYAELESRSASSYKVKGRSEGRRMCFCLTDCAVLGFAVNVVGVAYGSMDGVGVGRWGASRSRSVRKMSKVVAVSLATAFTIYATLAIFVCCASSLSTQRDGFSRACSSTVSSLPSRLPATPFVSGLSSSPSPPTNSALRLLPALFGRRDHAQHDFTRTVTHSTLDSARWLLSGRFTRSSSQPPWARQDRAVACEAHGDHPPSSNHLRAVCSVVIPRCDCLSDACACHGSVFECETKQRNRSATFHRSANHRVHGAHACDRVGVSSLSPSHSLVCSSLRVPTSASFLPLPCPFPFSPALTFCPDKSAPLLAQ